MSEEGDRSPWLKPLPEEYGEVDNMTGRRTLVAVLTVVVLTIFGGLIWYSYVKGNDGGPVPVIHADNSVVKEKPASPGGLDVPDQDKRVFNRIASNSPANDERLGASSELPLERPVASPSPTNDSIEPPSPTQTDNTAQTDHITPAEKGVNMPVPAAIKAEERNTMGDFLVQLGAFGKKSAAEHLWKKLKQENALLLGQYSADIMRVDLGKKGMLYRLRGGMMVDRAAAEKICSDLRKKAQACIVVAK